MKKRLLTAVLAFLFGNFGIHRFYLNQPGLGILYLLTCGLFGIGSIIDTIAFLLMDDDVFDARYNTRAFLSNRMKGGLKQRRLPRKQQSLLVAKQLKELESMYEKGSINFEEFEYLKQKLLSEI